MIFVIPIGHESDKVRRLPWISFIIMAACLIIHTLVSVEINQRAKELKSGAKELVDYYFKHPYLKLDPETKKRLFGERNNEEIEKMLDIYRRDAARSIHLFQEEEQEKLDKLSKSLINTVNDLPYRKWGFIPAKKSFIGLLTYMFIHGGWLHLLGNLLLLYLTGPFIEDVWGRPIYTGFYLIVGMLSALMFAQHFPHFTGPLIGASGAIAGLMGAFLIRYWNTRIKFFFIFAFIFRGTFKAPAWLMLPLWVLFEFFNANAIGSVNAEGGGVAHWAHVWGFVFGVAAALGMKALKIEEKYVHPKIEAQVHFVDEGYKAFEEAMLKKSEGKLDEAYALLLGAARKNPTNNDVVEGLWNLGVELGKENEAAEFFIRSIENEIRRDQMEIALNNFMDLKEKIPQASLSLTYKFMLMKHLTERKDFKEAKELANELVEEVDLNSSGGLLQNFASTALEFSPLIAKKVIELCLQHPGIPVDEKDKLKTELDELQKRLQATEPVNNVEQVTTEAKSQLEVKPVTTEAESQLAVEPDRSETSLITKKSIVAIKATPLGIKNGKIDLNMEGFGQQLLPLNSVQSIAAAEISSPQEMPFLLIDLFLDDPKTNSTKIRTIRLSSIDFDPKKLFPGFQDDWEALKAFISILLKVSGATAYPDQDSVLLDPPLNFYSIKEYEKSILSQKFTSFSQV